MKLMSFRRLPSATGVFSKLILAALGLAFLPAIQAADGTWTKTNVSSANWSDTANWSGTTVADGASATANFTAIQSGTTRTVNIDTASRTVGIFNLLNQHNTPASSQSFTFATTSAQTLTFDNGASTAQLNITNGTSTGGGTNTFSLGVLLGSSLDVANNRTLAANTLTFSGPISAASAGTKTLSNVGTGPAPVVISGIVSNGTGTVAVRQSSATSNLTLSGVNTYSGGTRIEAGRITVAADSGLGAVSGSVIFDGGTLATSASVIFDASRAATLNAGGGTFAADYFINWGGIISGSGLLTKTGTSTLSLNNVNNSNSGGIQVNAGILRVRTADGSFGAAGNNITFASGTNFLIQDAFTAGSGRTLNLTSGNVNFDIRSDFTWQGSIAGDGGFTKIFNAASGILTLSGTNTYSGGTTVNSGTVSITSDANLGATSGVLTLSTGTLLFTAAAPSTISRNITLGAGGGTITTATSTVTADGVISGAGGLTKSGTTLTLSNTNTYEGGTTINSGSILIGSDANLGASTGSVTLNGGNLQFSANLTSARNIATTSTSAGGFSTNLAADNVIWTGEISGVGRINKSGSGSIYLQGNNTYQGGTFLTNGTIKIDTDANLGTAAGVLTFGTSGGTLNILQTTTASRDVVLSAPATFAISSTVNTTTWNGNFSGAAALTKTFSGTLVLNGTSTHTGGITVNGGTVAINGNFSAATGDIAVTAGKLIVGADALVSPTNGITVGSGTALLYNATSPFSKTIALNGTALDSRAVLGGSGTIGTAVTLDNIGDTLSPGNSPGILNFSTSQSWDAFSYDWQVNDFTGTTAGSDFDLITISGGLTLNPAGTYQLNALSLTAANASGEVPNFSEQFRSWTVLTTTSGIAGFDAARWTIGTTLFSPVPADSFSLNVVGNDLVLSYGGAAIPEPSTYAALAGGLALVGALLHRRRRRQTAN